MRIKLAWFLLLLVVVGAVVVAQNDDEEAVMDFGDESGDAESDPTVLIQDKHVYVRPVVTGEHYFVETFEEETLIGGKWVKSEAKKDGVEDESIAKYDGAWSIESSRDSVLEGDKGLVLKSKAKHHAISSRLVKPFRFDTNAKSLVIQYEVKFQNVLECGGAYVKLLATDPKLTLEQFYDKTSFSIMFGPDKCGGESKYHFILRFRNPKTGVYEEHHAKKSELPDGLFADGKTHLYTLIIKPDNTYQMLIDNADINTGSLLSDLTPPINPPKEIVDPEDKKPVDWDDREQIADPEAVKPADWDETEPKLIDDAEAVKPDGWLDDEPEMIDDEMAIKPEDWDVETDGEWEAPKLENPKCKSAPGCGKWSPPQIANPKYKGKWSAPLVNNPRYQGIWEPRKIENPAYFEDEAPFKSLTSFEAVGLELWSMTDQIYFDNFIITDDEAVANEFAQASWAIKKKLESQRSASQGSSDSVVGAFMKAAEDKPWLWAVVVLVVLLPIILIVVFCCGSSSKTSSVGAGDAKKTDAVQPDDNQAAQSSSNQQAEDEEEQEEEEEQQQQEEEEVTEAKKSPIKKRARKD